MSQEKLSQWVDRDLLERVLDCCIAGRDNTIECLNEVRNHPMAKSITAQLTADMYESEIANFQEVIKDLEAVLGSQE